MFQYGLRTLLVVMLLASLVVWALFVLPSPASTFVLDGLLTVATAMIVAGIVYFRGYQQAFCVGAAPAQLHHLFGFLSLWRAPLWMWISPASAQPDDADWNMKVNFACAIAFMFLAGVAGMSIRFFAVRAAEGDKDPRIISQGQPRD